MSATIYELFSNPENSKMFKRIPAKFVGASNVYLTKINYNYTNQNKFSYLNGLIFKSDADPFEATVDDIEIIVNVLPNITYSNESNAYTRADLQEGKKSFKYYDGTWFRLFWNKYLNAWKFATSQLVNGEIATWNNVEIGHSFEKFVNTLDTDKLDRESTYFFVYSHPMITFDPSVTEEHVQFIARVHDGKIVDSDEFDVNNEEIDEKSNIMQVNDTGVNIIVQNDLYAEIKKQFRTDINTIFLHFYAKPNENMHVMKLFFEVVPRFLPKYEEFIHNPLLEALIMTITDFTTRNISRYFNNMVVRVNKLNSTIFKIWVNMLMRVDPNYVWDHNNTPFENLRQMNIQYVALLTNPIYVRELLSDLPIKDVMEVLS